MRSRGRAIARETFLSAVETFALVEAYPEVSYLPSYLVLVTSNVEAFHILFAVDVLGDEDEAFAHVDVLLETADEGAELEVVQYAA